MFIDNAAFNPDPAEIVVALSDDFGDKTGAVCISDFCFSGCCHLSGELLDGEMGAIDSTDPVIWLLFAKYWTCSSDSCLSHSTSIFALYTAYIDFQYLNWKKSTIFLVIPANRKLPSD